MTGPLLLGFDTSAAHCAAALLRGDDCLASRAEPMKRGQAERLMPLLEELLAEAGCTWADLDGIGVGTGPGNFTGIRISVSAARGLALALDIPAIGVDLFDVARVGAEAPLAAWLPAPREAAYLQHPGKSAEQVPMAEIKALGDAAIGLPEPAEIGRRIAALAAARLDAPGPAPAPVYMRPADAAPPRDPAPRIVP
ncbi:tRNA (adenosine(37)-N6)-threonylcarbamoyltransferase complex dimerization subunit type 1 TsaB [Poseidonocella sedimentorum]|uniref:tRNA threonylcarbamoyl adenosine modification protein YeaZ n=1 Tax=Poseidonocella sedimentorum TaxID=871652 RepID=A0A1I6DS73_9RHOB|nr:tRNA (adenosine(37)-N6)-threonylcarbamoyltransferase complex dimerization subunit type 1 TsaB [Poseidonocella sedimentorum]SFR08286.1 tRNA threonylcarbamoyl adenosine modification protein YeaZ [Poseidonocella sedimentorum]